MYQLTLASTLGTEGLDGRPNPEEEVGLVFEAVEYDEPGLRNSMQAIVDVRPRTTKHQVDLQQVALASSIGRTFGSKELW